MFQLSPEEHANFEIAICDFKFVGRSAVRRTIP